MLTLLCCLLWYICVYTTFSHITHTQNLCCSSHQVPLNNKETMLQRQISIHDESETETGQEALEEPLKAKKRRENDNWKGRNALQRYKFSASFWAICTIYHFNIMWYIAKTSAAKFQNFTNSHVVCYWSLYMES